MIKKYKKNLLLISYTLITIFFLRINIFSTVSYSQSNFKFLVGDCLSSNKAIFYKITDITEKNYYVLKCYHRTDIYPPSCNENEWEIPVDEFEAEFDFISSESDNECPSGTRIALF
jgi:hypothetical protein